MLRETCGTCRWMTTPDAKNLHAKDCRRFPPTAQVVPAAHNQVQAIAVYPPVRDNTFACGEHMPKPALVS